MTPSDGYRLLVKAFNELKIEFFVGGSIASSLHGIPRGTRDVDIIAAILPKHIRAFSKILEADFYADPDMMRDAIGAGRSFNLIHLETSYKFDIFPLQSDEFHQLQFARRKARDLAQSGLPGEGSFVASAEDTLLEKLNWYLQGGSASERQWNDILSILNVQGANLDGDYLERWATHLKVHDLLVKARSEAEFAM